MKWKTASPQRRLYLISAVILLAGLGSAAVIYLGAENDAGNPLIKDFESSKRYVHGLEMYGGKMNVLIDQFRRWFASFWKGKTLAFTVAGITLFTASVVAFVASRSPAEPDSDSRNVKRPVNRSEKN